LRRLGLDYVDLYQAHAPDKDAPIEETLEAFEDLVRAGKTRYVGFSNFDRDPALLRRAVAHQKTRGWSRFISSQPRYSLVDRHAEPEHLGFCRRNGIGLIVYSPLAQGVLTNKYVGGAKPEGSRIQTSFAHFLTNEKALTEENVAAAERFADWVARRGLGTPAQVALAWVLRRPEVSSAIIRREPPGSARGKSQGLRAEAERRRLPGGRGCDPRRPAGLPWRAKKPTCAAENRRTSGTKRKRGR